MTAPRRTVRNMPRLRATLKSERKVAEDEGLVLMVIMMMKALHMMMMMMMMMKAQVFCWIQTLSHPDELICSHPTT